MAQQAAAARPHCDAIAIAFVVNLFKPEVLLNDIKEFSSYLTGNTLRLQYKAQPVNAVWGNSRCLL
jgi:hypothetical protein